MPRVFLLLFFCSCIGLSAQEYNSGSVDTRVGLSSNNFKGFDPVEARNTLALCNSYTFLDLYGSDATIIPKGHRRVFTSEVKGLDNKFQVYTNGKTGVINFRGSTDKLVSWVENIYSAMIPATGQIHYNERDLPYKFAVDTLASVHSGYVLGIVLLAPQLLEQLEYLNQKGIYDILITGHSQGGALANLCRAYFENLPAGSISMSNRFKTYAYANPMCGNLEFSKEFKKRYVDPGTSFSLINPEDPIPKMPMHYQEEEKLISKDRVLGWLTKEETFDIKQLGIETVMRSFEGGLTAYINTSNRLLERILSTTRGKVDLPDYRKDINYYQVGQVMKIDPAIYPKIRINTAEMREKKVEKMKQAADGYYYKEEPMYYQHKPYNYYVSFLKTYFPEMHSKLKVLYLKENLD